MASPASLGARSTPNSDPAFPRSRHKKPGPSARSGKNRSVQSASPRAHGCDFSTGSRTIFVAEEGTSVPTCMSEPKATRTHGGKTAKHAAHAAVLPPFVATLLAAAEAAAEAEGKLIDELCAAVLCGDLDAAKNTATALTGRRGHQAASQHPAL